MVLLPRSLSAHILPLLNQVDPQCLKYFIQESSQSITDEELGVVEQFIQIAVGAAVDELWTLAVSVSECETLFGTMKNRMKTNLQSEVTTLHEDQRQFLRTTLDVELRQDGNIEMAIVEQLLINGFDGVLASRKPSVEEQTTEPDTQAKSERLDNLKKMAKALNVETEEQQIEDEIVEAMIDVLFPTDVSNMDNTHYMELLAEKKAENANKQATKISQRGKKKKNDETKRKQPKRSQQKPKATETKRTPNKKTKSAVNKTSTSRPNTSKMQRPPLKKGVTVDDLQNYYWLGELKEFCKTNSLRAVGKKSILNKRICLFLNEGVVEGPKKPISKKRKRTAKSKTNKRRKLDNTNTSALGGSLLRRTSSRSTHGRRQSKRQSTKPR
eukprot:TRINITY_DN53457_c0_g1_i1.p2 TRINITY_DN53457_c0_g1~~TRINITY_DN53457_c0_g1_i1.p2  ORF type:complete len:384 (+),score=56.89 TRINITY_DN53457_c0_g1_i1:56-1207(+)